MRHPDEPFAVKPDEPTETKSASVRPPKAGTPEFLAYLKSLREIPPEKEGEAERITFGDPGKRTKRRL